MFELGRPRPGAKKGPNGQIERPVLIERDYAAAGWAWLDGPGGLYELELAEIAARKAEIGKLRGKDASAAADELEVLLVTEKNLTHGRVKQAELADLAIRGQLVAVKLNRGEGDTGKIKLFPEKFLPSAVKLRRDALATKAYSFDLSDPAAAA